MKKKQKGKNGDSKRHYKNHSQHKKITSSVIKSSENKKKEIKKKNFESHTEDPKTNKLGVWLEYITVLIKMLMLFAGLLCGVWMIYKDIRDNGTWFKYGDLEYSGSLVGVIVVIICAIGLWRNRAKVTLFSSHNE